MLTGGQTPCEVKRLMKEINYKDMTFNPFNLIGDEWMLVTAGDENSCNTMTASWGHLGCLWGQNDPTAVIYLRPSRYTKEFVDREGYFSLCVMDKSFKKQKMDSSIRKPSTRIILSVTSIQCTLARLRRCW